MGNNDPITHTGHSAKSRVPDASKNHNAGAIPEYNGSLSQSLQTNSRQGVRISTKGRNQAINAAPAAILGEIFILRRLFSIGRRVGARRCPFGAAI